MVWWMVLQVFTTLLEMMQLGRKSESKKDLEILLLRRQLAIYERKETKAPRLTKGEKLTLVVLAGQLKTKSGQTIRQMGKYIRIVKPQTLFRWHGELIRRKWTNKTQNKGGRPRKDKELERLVVRLALENDWGHCRIEGELKKLGYEISDETVGNILHRHGIPPAGERKPSLSWRHLMTHYKDQILACDFFTVETLFLRTLYVLVFIEIGSRRVYFAGCTTNPDKAWVSQQARQMVWELEEREQPIRFLIRDNDGKYAPAFDTVFRSEGIDVIPTPYRAPNANAYMERWIRSAREECLDKVLVINQEHLRRIMREYVEFFNMARPHQGLEQRIPIPKSVGSQATGPVRCRNVLGGIIHDYHRDAA
jgi:putative transposase